MGIFLSSARTIGMPNPASVYCSSLKNVKYTIVLERCEVGTIKVFNDNKWDTEWNLIRRKGKNGIYLWLVDIEKSLLNSSRNLNFQDDSQISLLQSKCDEINANLAIINSGYLCNGFPYEKRGAVCIFQDKTIIHASILLEQDWKNQIDLLKAKL